ncbi:hypothetical protein K461DRAFT_293461 [Myriangium duriaei CBS 260.36]|uniref:Ras-associating domain-containing protein n=1 Tax=Myriangium duriaei CBS 260.36 TaxID=1168546 RepID=A0A9P4MG50_9PEZI|nr:hypothetical protein K461DRAFT_293461 [Myriangium duriaei CBS 260.36]
MDPPDSSRPSRYRSVRASAAAPHNEPPHEPMPAADLAQDPSTVNRTRSRYHRKAPSAAPNSPPVPAMSPEISHSPPQDAHVSPLKGGVQRVRQASDAFAEHSREYLSAPTPPIAQERVLTPRAEAERRRRLDDNSASRQANLDAPRGREQASKSSDTQRPPTSYNRQDSPMLGSGSSQEKASGSAAPQQIYATTVNVKEEKSASCFGGLFKRKKDMVHQQPEKNMGQSSKDAQFIKQGGGGIVPGTDAPKSAVNSGERRVLIECNRSSMQFPVDPTTTASDLLQSAANCFSEPIDPKTFVLIEFFGKVGVQRPLRRYEHVRDVMNSWDDDVQNSIIVMPAVETGADPALLHANNVPRLKPEDTSFTLHYSQKVGKWDRRFITIRQDGQVVAKKNSNSADKDAVNVCHLSDFDIYTPTIRQTSKKIRPPKKLCFAIKSQQKSSMFETTTDFVHFFCTSEKDTAIAFYTAVQGWRSWYLVNMMGEGQKKVKSPNMANGLPDRTLSVKQAHHARNTSNMSMESHYQLGSFKPLVDTEAMNFGPTDEAMVRRSMSKREHKQESPQRKQTLRENEPLVNLVDKRISVDGGARDSGTFAHGGLLGRTYSQRQREQAAREAVTTTTAAQPFTSGPSLLNNDTLHRTASNRNSGGRPGTSSADIRRQPSTRQRESLDIQRSASQRGPKPLVDLTPTYREPPQHQRKGRGYNAATSQPGGLINAATSPDDPLNIPSSTDWRGRNSVRDTAPDPALQQRARAKSSAARDRSRSQPRRPSVPQPRFQNTAAYAALTGGPEPMAPPSRQGSGGLVAQVESRDTGGAFVPGGLLEHAAGGWGDANKGRGVSTKGHHQAGKPLVDLSEGGMYGKGSLLERMERSGGGNGN